MVYKCSGDTRLLSACMFGIYARMIHNGTGGARRLQGRSPLYKSDAANTLPLSGTEGSLRVQKETLSFVGRGTFEHWL